MKSRHYTFPALALAAALYAPLSWGLDSSEYTQVQQAISAGEILPVRQVIDQVEKDFPGKVVEIELDRENLGWVYEVKTLGTGGQVNKLKLNARDGKVLYR